DDRRPPRELKERGEELPTNSVEVGRTALHRPRLVEKREDFAPSRQGGEASALLRIAPGCVTSDCHGHLDLILHLVCDPAVHVRGFLHSRQVLCLLQKLLVRLLALGGRCLHRVSPLLAPARCGPCERGVAARLVITCTRLNWSEYRSWPTLP